MSTKPEKTAEQLLKQIYTGIYKIGERLPAERKLAKLFDCTQFTVSKAISILEEKGLVEKKRGSGNYVKTNKATFTVAFLTCERDSKINPIWHAFYDALNVLTSNSNINFLLCVIPQQSDEIPSFKLNDADIIISALGLREMLITKILDLNKPVIWLEEYNRELPGATVSFDNFQAGAIAAEHLFECGCRNLVYMQYDNFIYPSQRRFEGFQKTLQTKQEFFNLITYTWLGEDIEEMKRLQNLLKKENAIDGVFCFSDHMVPWVMRAAFSMSRRIPEDLKIISIDGSELSRIFIPSFTTIEQSAVKIAKTTYVALKKIMRGNISTDTKFIEPKLILRNSTMLNPPELKHTEIPGIALHV